MRRPVFTTRKVIEASAWHWPVVVSVRGVAVIGSVAPVGLVPRITIVIIVWVEGARLVVLLVVIAVVIAVPVVVTCLVIIVVPLFPSWVVGAGVGVVVIFVAVVV